MNNINKVLISILIASVFMMPISSVNNSISLFDDTSFVLHVDVVDGGWLEERDGVKILHVSGSYYEMGYQHGYLLKNEIEQNYRALLSMNPGLYDSVLALWNSIARHYIPQEYIEEMEGLANGSGIPFEEVAVYTSGCYGFLFSECMELSAWGPATADGKLYHFYSQDLPLHCADPESGAYIQDNMCLMVREPADGYASVHAVFSGVPTAFGGFNEHAIAISLETSPSSYTTSYAIPAFFRNLMVLDHASTADEALDIMQSSTHGGINYVISDGKIPGAFVCEEIANYTYVGTWDDEVESTSPFWTIDYVVRRKNMFIHPETATTQRACYDPRRILINAAFSGGYDYFNTWRYYKTLSKETEKTWGELNISSIISMIRSIYRGETDIALKLYNILDLEQFSSCQQSVACPETGDFIISFADGKHQAQYNELHFFNFYELLEADPPP